MILINSFCIPQSEDCWSLLSEADGLRPIFELEVEGGIICGFSQGGQAISDLYRIFGDSGQLLGTSFYINIFSSLIVMVKI